MRIRKSVVGVLVLAACAGEAPKKDRALPPERTAARDASAATSGEAPVPRVLIIGTSLTAGLGLDESDAYPAVLQRKADSAGLRVRIVNAGLSGETSAGALRRAEWLLREPVALVVIETGANDGLRGLDIDSTRANLRAMVEVVRAQAPNADVVLAQMEAPPNFGAAYTSRFHAMYGEVAKATGTVVMPFLLEGVAGVGRLNQADGIHPSKAGAVMVAANVWRFLEPRMRRLDRR